MVEHTPSSIPITRVLALCLALAIWVPPAAADVPAPSPVPQLTAPGETPRVASRRRLRYVVQSGDTLGGIAQDFGVSVRQIRRWNSLEGDMIREGQELVLRVEDDRGRSGRNEMVYVVEGGDTLGRIADRYDVEIDDLVRWNRGLDVHMIRIGQEIRIRVPGAGHDSSSIGSPTSGRLSGGHQLRTGPGYRVRNPSRAYGTEMSVRHIQRAFERVAARFPDSAAAAIGDLSYARGGRMRPHVSHQSGRDADIAYYNLGSSDGGAFTSVSPETLDVRRTWYLLKTLLDTGDVRYIFIDRELQEPLYEYVRLRGASDQQLSEWFQYPSESGTDAIIRHEDGHDDHFHIRFRCRSEDGRCQN